MKQAAYKINDFLFGLKVNNSSLLSKFITGFALINIIILLPDVYDLFSTSGYIQAEINNTYLYDFDPLLNWVLEPLSMIGISSDYGLFLIIGIYIFSLFFALIDSKPLTFSIIAWIIHVMMINSSYHFSYGADYFITFSLFINILLNLDFVKKAEASDAIQSFAIRMVQLQLCFVYFFAGFGKAIGFDWLDGNAMWYIFNIYSPEFVKGVLPAIAEFPIIFKVLSWSVLILELSYPIFMYIKKTKRVFIYAVIAMHIGIMLLMGLYTFGLIMIILNVIAFGNHLIPDFLQKKIPERQIAVTA